MTATPRQPFAHLPGVSYPQRTKLPKFVKHEGRMVARAWYRCFVLKEPPRPRPVIKRIIVSLYLPAVQCTREPPETRLVNLNRQSERAWIADLSCCYARQGGELPTFFASLGVTPAVDAAGISIRTTSQGVRYAFHPDHA